MSDVFLNGELKGVCSEELAKVIGMWIEQKDARIKELEAESAKMRELMHKAVAEAAAVHLLTDYEALEDSIDAMASYLLRELAMEASDE